MQYDEHNNKMIFSELEKQQIKEYKKIVEVHKEEKRKIARFFAFSATQYEEQKAKYLNEHPEDENKKFIHIDGGIYMTKENFEKYKELCKRHREEKEAYKIINCVLYYMFYNAFNNFEYCFLEQDEAIARSLNFENFKEIEDNKRINSIYEQARAHYLKNIINLY